MLIPKSGRNSQFIAALNNIITGHLDEYYDRYKIGIKSYDYDHRILNWFYTVRCETEYSGRDLCDYFLWSLKDTIAKYDWPPQEKDFKTCKLLIYILMLKIRPNL